MPSDHGLTHQLSKDAQLVQNTSQQAGKRIYPFDDFNKSSTLLGSPLQVPVFALWHTGWWGRSWAISQQGKPWSSSTRRWQMAVPFPTTSQTGSEHPVPTQGAKYQRMGTVMESGKTNKPPKNNPKEEFWKKIFSPARIRGSALQLALFTSSNSNSKRFKVLLHFFFLWKQKWQQLKQNWEWENPKIEIITNQTRGLYTGWWSHWPALPSNFSSCRLWWVLYF